LEQKSESQLRTINYIDRYVAFHCASRCCEAARGSVNRRLRKSGVVQNSHETVTPVCQSARTVASAALALVCFVHSFRRKTRHVPGCHVIQRYSGTLMTHELELDAHDGIGEPIVMSSSHDGDALLYTTTVVCAQMIDDDEDDDVEVHAMLWNPKVSAVPIRIESIHDSLLYPIAVWWRWAPHSTMRQPAVAFSTTWVDAKGLDQYKGDDVLDSERYSIETFEMWSDNFLSEMGDYTRFGRLISLEAATNDTANRCVSLVRQMPTLREETVYVARVYSDCSPRHQPYQLQHNQIWKGLANTTHRDGFDWGPSAVGISPSGDCIVCVHITGQVRGIHDVTAEVFDVVDGTKYVRVNSMSLTQWIGYDTCTVVKLRFKIGFSSCGRFVTICDQLARWGYQFSGYAMAVLDLSKRRMRRKITCHTLSRCESCVDYMHLSNTSTPVRSLEWRAGAVWAMSFKGLLLIRM